MMAPNFHLHQRPHPPHHHRHRQASMMTIVLFALCIVVTVTNARYYGSSSSLSSNLNPSLYSANRNPYPDDVIEADAGGGGGASNNFNIDDDDDDRIPSQQQRQSFYYAPSPDEGAAAPAGASSSIDPNDDEALRLASQLYAAASQQQQPSPQYYEVVDDNDDPLSIGQQLQLQQQFLLQQQQQQQQPQPQPQQEQPIDLLQWSGGGNSKDLISALTSSGMNELGGGNNDDGIIIRSSSSSDGVGDNNNSQLQLANAHAIEDQHWSDKLDKSILASSSPPIGDVVGIAASQDFLYIFHRGNVTWNERSFNDETNVYNHQNEPITVPTVVALDLATGEIEFTWGKNSFFMPHGISCDPQGNIWLTDVALHQAFRYKKNSFNQPDLVLGERFVPGDDETHFCKPTDVAIASSGVVYISDGYCNSRVVIFSPAGKYLTEIGNNDKMLIPHSVTLLEIENLVCVADRENGRIMCYDAGLKSFRQAGQLLFAVTHTAIRKLYAIAHIGDVILALNGGEPSTTGVSVDLATESVIDQWSPTTSTSKANGTGFYFAHDLTVSHDGRSFFVAQFDDTTTTTTTTSTSGKSVKNQTGDASGGGGHRKKLFKFDMIEPSQPYLMH